MKILFEIKRKDLLIERFSKAEGEAALGPENKKMRRAYTKYLSDQERGPWEYDRDDPDYREYEADPAKIKGIAARLIRWIWDVVPSDLAGIEAGNDPKKKAKEVDTRQGLILMWIRKLIIKTPDIIDEFIDGNPRGDLWGSFEHFFQHNHLMPQKELLKVKSFEELHQIVVDTKPAIEEFRQSRLKSPKMIAEGTTFLRGDWKYDFMKGGVDEKAYKKFVELSKSEMENLSADEAKAIRRQRQQEALETAGGGGWVIMEIHNKAASCFHGVIGWCTAAPGQSYFEEYYKPDDPLFIFEDKDSREKYQFHYGTEQFMDQEDAPASEQELKKLHSMLLRTAAAEKYEKVNDPKLKIKYSENPEELLAITKGLIDPAIVNIEGTGVDSEQRRLRLNWEERKYEQGRIFNSIVNNTSTPTEALEDILFDFLFPVLEAAKGETTGDLTSRGGPAARAAGHSGPADIIAKIASHDNMSAATFEKLLDRLNVMIKESKKSLDNLISKKESFLKAGGDEEFFRSLFKFFKTKSQLIDKILLFVGRNIDQTTPEILQKAVETYELNKQNKSKAVAEAGEAEFMQSPMPFGYSALAKVMSSNPNSSYDSLIKILKAGTKDPMLQDHYSNSAKNILSTIIENTLDFEEGEYEPGMPTPELEVAGLLPDARFSIDQLKQALKVATITQPRWVVPPLESREDPNGDGGGWKAHWQFGRTDNVAYLVPQTLEYLGIDEETVKGWTKDSIRDWRGKLKKDPTGEKQEIEEQTEPFQKAVKKKHRKMKIRLIGKGGNKYVSTGMKKPSYKRAKSAPAGFGGSLEESIDYSRGSHLQTISGAWRDFKKDVNNLIENFQNREDFISGLWRLYRTTDATRTQVLQMLPDMLDKYPNDIDNALFDFLITLTGPVENWPKEENV